MNVLKQFFEMLSRKRALKVVRRQINKQRVLVLSSAHFKIFDQLPDNCHIYMTYPIDKPCWFVKCPWGDGQDGSMLRSCRLMLLTRWGGKVVYDGSAGDEG
jgi:hypothetical protein